AIDCHTLFAMGGRYPLDLIHQRPPLSMGNETSGASLDRPSRGGNSGDFVVERGPSSAARAAACPAVRPSQPRTRARNGPATGKVAIPGWTKRRPRREHGRGGMFMPESTFGLCFG